MNQPEVGTSANRTEDFSELKIGERDEDFRRDYKKNRNWSALFSKQSE